MKTDIEIQFEADSEQVTAIANEQLRLNAAAARESISKREAEEAAEREAEEKARKDAAEARRARRSPLAAAPVSAAAAPVSAAAAPVSAAAAPVS